MDDLISRQGVIEALSQYPFEKVVNCISIIEEFPSVQTNIVRCKDCKHWREGTAFSYCDKLYGMGVLDALDYMVAEDDYCSMAERRTE